MAKEWFFYAVMTAVFWGVTPIFEKLGVRNSPPFASAFFRCVGTAVGIIALLAIRPSTIKEAAGMDKWAMASLIFAGLLASVIGQISNMFALKAGEVSKVTPITGTWPFIAFLLGIMIFGEAITLQKMLAVLLIISGIILLRVH